MKLRQQVLFPKVEPHQLSERAEEWGLARKLSVKESSFNVAILKRSLATGLADRSFLIVFISHENISLEAPVGEFQVWAQLPLTQRVLTVPCSSD